jgi:RND family efflux transporter MFP subunit
MKKLKYIAIVVFVFAAIVVVLLNNKAKLQAKEKSVIKDAYYVSVDKAEATKITEDLSLIGTVMAYNDVNVLSETSGRITQVFAKIGDYKPAGSVLVQVDDELKKAALILAQANYDKSKKDYERFVELHKQKSATDAQLDGARLNYVSAEAQLIVAKRQLDDTKVKTPISGVITSRPVDVGSTLQGAPQPTLVANVVDVSRLKIKLNVPESIVFKLKVGDYVEASTQVYPNVKFNGRVETISAKGDEAHTYPLEIVITNDGKHPLKAGMFANVNFTTLERDQVLSVPREAIIGSIKDPKVFVVENGIAKLKQVVTGASFGTKIEIINGLIENEIVVVSGQNSLRDNIKVEVLK